jgi:arabinan endo-1,5-alpha-L-arabinosidase
MRLAPLVTLTALLLALAGLAAPAAGAAPAAPPLHGDLDVHDPGLLTGGPGEKWYVFASGKPGKGGGTIDIRRSADGGRTWAYDGTIWDAMPSWLTETVPGANNMWAPAIHRHGGVYYLYYAVSTIGKNNSVIALATNTTLDRADPAYKWVDQGKVIRSAPGSDFNAIDPEVVDDDAGTPWLVFGSYWSGIQMVQLEYPSGKRSADRERRHLADRKIALNAVEAPSIVRHDGWYYLLTSWDRCCLGTDSTYRIVAGRSRAVTGPYVDQDGRALTDGGGTTLLESAGDRVGPGGESVSGGVVAYHYYDGTAGGAPRLGLRKLAWGGDGWPRIPAGDAPGGRPAAP